MRQIPAWENVIFIHAASVVSVNHEHHSVVHSSIDLRNGFGHFVCWKTEGLSWK